MINIQENISLLPYNSFGIDATTKYFATFSNTDELKDFLVFAKKNKLKTLILGEGSNILFTQNFDGIVLKNKIKGIQEISSTNEIINIKVGGGENFNELVNHCVENNFYGLENLTLIPGSVGAAPVQNIGAYGVEVKDFIEEVTFFDIEKNCITTLPNADCHFGYRESIFKTKLKDKAIILYVSFKLLKKPNFKLNYGTIKQELEKLKTKEISAKTISEAVKKIRQAKLPAVEEFGSAGSFFKNPIITKSKLEKLQTKFPEIKYFETENLEIKISAAWLIEQCGWKGKRKGDCGCFPTQPLVIVNYGQATGKEIFQFSEEIIQSVSEKFEIKLEREVNVI